MKIVIDIQDNYYERLVNDFNNVTDNVSIGVKDILFSVKNGTPLPKGYGDLIDRKELLKHTYRIDDSATLSTRDVVDVEEIVNAPTIIEADREVEDGE